MTNHIDALLPDYLERTLSSEERQTVDAHLAECAECRALATDLQDIIRDAGALGPIEPPRDLWAGIAARIEAPVVPLGRTGEHVLPRRAERRFASRRWLAAAAAVLVAVSVGSTYLVMRTTGRAAPTTVAAVTTPAPMTNAPTSAPTTATPTRDSVAPSAPSTPRPVASLGTDAKLVSGSAEAYAPAMQTYDREIATLRTALAHRTDLDSATVAVVEKNLRVIDAAIAESRRALARDPRSRFLGDQLARTLDQKVELLRTAVLLPSRS